MQPAWRSWVTGTTHGDPNTCWGRDQHVLGWRPTGAVRRPRVPVSQSGQAHFSYSAGSWTKRPPAPPSTCSTSCVPLAAALASTMSIRLWRSVRSTRASFRPSTWVQTERGSRQRMEHSCDSMDGPMRGADPARQRRRMATRRRCTYNERRVSFPAPTTWRG